LELDLLAEAELTNKNGLEGVFYFFLKLFTWVKATAGSRTAVGHRFAEQPVPQDGPGDLIQKL
jgi:hypothetical protein